MRSRHLFSLLFLSACAASSSALAQTQSISGKLFVTYSDSLTATRSRLDYEVRTNKGKRYKLLFPRERAGLLTGQSVRVKGRALGAGKIRVGASEESFAVESAGEVSGLSGVQTAVVLRIQSATSVTAATEAQLAQEVANVASRLAEHSFGIASLSNDKDNDGLPDVKTVVLPDSTAGQGESIAFSLCSKAKSAAGVSGYRHYICILPPDMNYSWYGQAYVGGTDSVIDGAYAYGYPNGLIHELGHNWGEHHANSPTAEYGDSTCIMGGNAGTANRHFNAPHKVGLGWISPLTVGSGTHKLAPVESSSGTRVLKFRDTVGNRDIYISTRARLGSFSSGPINPGTTHIHTWSPGARSVVLATLATGQTWSQNGIAVTQVAHDGTMADVAISTACVTAAPSIQIAPTSFTTNAAVATSYAVTVRNNDVNCSDSTSFSVSASSASPALTATVGSSVVSVAPGQSVSLSLDAIPSVDLGSGSYVITLNASGAGHALGSGTARYVLDTLAPSAATLSGSTQKNRASLSWSGAADSGGSGIKNFDILRNNVLIATVSGSSYVDQPGSGTHSYAIRARDNAGNISALSNSVSLTLSGGGRRK